MKDKAYGMMIGLVVGDILGAPVQFGANSRHIRGHIEKLKNFIVITFSLRVFTLMTHQWPYV